MKKIILLVIISVTFFGHSYSQDIIKTKAGEEIKARLLKLNRKEATYKSVDDPEFSTYTIPYKELATIQMQGEKKPVYFNHQLPRAFIGGSFGGSVPLGSLRQTDYESSEKEPGFAKQGVSFNLDAGFYLYRKIGLSVGVGSYNNKFDYSKYADVYNGTGGGGYDYYTARVAQDSSNFTKDRWRFKYGFIGPMYSAKINKRITWDIMVRVGFVDTRNPAIQLEHTIGSYKESYYYQSTSKTVLSYNAAMNFRIMVTKRLSFLLSANYIGTNPTLNVPIQSPYNSNQTSVDIDYKFSSLNINFGLAFQFKRKGNKYE